MKFFLNMFSGMRLAVKVTREYFPWIPALTGAPHEVQGSRVKHSLSFALLNQPQVIQEIVVLFVVFLCSGFRSPLRT